jgi:AraC-like DNA-binding protein
MGVLEMTEHLKKKAVNQGLIDKVMQLAPTEGQHATTMPMLSITRWDHPGRKGHCFFSPSITLVLQGKKESTVGTNVYRYGELDYTVNGVYIPGISGVIEAEPLHPMLSLTIMLDKNLTTEIVSEMVQSIPISNDDSCCVSVGHAGIELIDVFTRMINLLDKPGQLPIMAPLLVREAITRVLIGPSGAALSRIYYPGSFSGHIATAIEWLKRNYMHQLIVENLAREVYMATSTFHRKFKLMTTLSPLQYQKRLRLYEARRLMLSENMDANTAGLIVGYESAQQFNREYKRMFGEPPFRDINRLRRK